MISHQLTAVHSDFYKSKRDAKRDSQRETRKEAVPKRVTRDERKTSEEVFVGGFCRSFAGFCGNSVGAFGKTLPGKVFQRLTVCLKQFDA